MNVSEMLKRPWGRRLDAPPAVGNDHTEDAPLEDAFDGCGEQDIDEAEIQSRLRRLRLRRIMVRALAGAAIFVAVSVASWLWAYHVAERVGQTLNGG